jgi:hypothetical protein
MITDKPIIISEIACTEQGGDKAAWISDAFDALKTRYPRIKAFTWFELNKETDWRINSSASALTAYRSALSADYFLDKVVEPSSILPPRAARVNNPLRLRIGLRRVCFEAAEDVSGVGALELYRLDGKRVMVLEPVVDGERTVWQAEGVVPACPLVAHWRGAQFPDRIVRFVK